MTHNPEILHDDLLSYLFSVLALRGRFFREKPEINTDSCIPNREQVCFHAASARIKQECAGDSRTDEPSCKVPHRCAFLCASAFRQPRSFLQFRTGSSRPAGFTVLLDFRHKTYAAYLAAGHNRLNPEQFRRLGRVLNPNDWNLNSMMKHIRALLNAYATAAGETDTAPASDADAAETLAESLNRS